MSAAVSAVLRPVPMPTSDVLRRDPAAQAFLLLGALTLSRLASANFSDRSAPRVS
jgi:hypothetical protein